MRVQVGISAHDQGPNCVTGAQKLAAVCYFATVASGPDYMGGRVRFRKPNRFKYFDLDQKTVAVLLARDDFRRDPRWIDSSAITPRESHCSSATIRRDPRFPI